MHILDKYILENHLNLAELANILGYDTGNLSKVINGIIGVSPRLANTIKQKLQLDIEVTKRPKRYNIIKEEPNQPNIQPQKTNIMKDQNYQIILSALTDKIQKLEEKLNHYEAVKPNTREVG